MRKSILISIFILVILYIVYFIINIFGILNKSYKNIDLAIENSELRGNEVIVELESNDCLYALIGKNGYSQWAYFYKDEAGWQYIFGRINIPKKVIIKSNYDLTYRRFRSKHIVNISIHEKYSDILQVRDSVDSYFETYKDEYSKEYFIVFDKLPENYIIHIGNLKYKMN